MYFCTNFKWKEMYFGGKFSVNIEIQCSVFSLKKTFFNTISINVMMICSTNQKLIPSYINKYNMESPKKLWMKPDETPKAEKNNANRNTIEIGMKHSHWNN